MNDNEREALVAELQQAKHDNKHGYYSIDEAIDKAIAAIRFKPDGEVIARLQLIVNEERDHRYRFDESVATRIEQTALDAITALRAAPSTPPAPASLAREKEAVHDMTARESLVRILRRVQNATIARNDTQGVWMNAQEDYKMGTPNYDKAQRLHDAAFSEYCNAWDEAAEAVRDFDEATDSALSSRNPIPSSAALTPGDAGGEGQGERVKQLEAEVAKLKEQRGKALLIGQTDWNNELKAANARIAELEAEVARLKGDLLGANLSGDPTKWRPTVQEMQTLEHERDDLRAQLAAEKKALADAHEIMTGLHEQLATPPAAPPPARPATDGKDGLRSLLQQMLDVAENCDETGYAADCGFVDLDKLHEKVRAALSRPPTPLPPEVRTKISELIKSGTAYCTPYGQMADAIIAIIDAAMRGAREGWSGEHA